MQRRDFLFSAGAAAGAAFAAGDPFDSLPASVLANARNNGLIMIRHPAPANLSHKALIVKDDEPGRRLVVAGEVFTPDGTTPAAGVTVYAYNTDAKGYYSEGGTREPPRIYGWMRTNDAGRFEFTTVYPGSYPGQRIPAHVHFAFWGAGYPPQWSEELRFEGDPYLTAEMLSRAEAEGAFRTVRPVTRSADGVAHTTYRAKLLRESNYR